MSERIGRGERPPSRQPAEGVRIIGAEEAQAALDAGAAAGRKPDDQLRFGDVPPAPPEPRPAHRFPLPDSVDPAGAVPLPPLAASGRTGAVQASDEGARPWEESRLSHGEESRVSNGEESRVSNVEESRVSNVEESRVSNVEESQWHPGDRTSELGLPDLPPRPEPPGIPNVGHRGPGEGITVTGGGTELPHWTDPPTGEVPRILLDPAEEGSEDDLEAWKALGSRGIRWRDADEDWDQGDEMADLAGDEDPVGALDQTRSEQSDLYSFDEDFERVKSRTGGVPIVSDYEEQQMTEPASGSLGPLTTPRHVRSRSPRPEPKPRVRRSPAPPAAGGDGDVTSRVVVGVGLVVLLIIAYAIGSKALVALSALVIVAAVAEAYGMLQRAGFRPATLLGLVGTVGVVFGAYWRGLEALPVVAVLVFAGSMMWYVLGIVEARPLANVAVTITVFVWVAMLGSFSGVMLAAANGKGLFLGAVVVAVAADIFAFLVGRWIGSRPIAASISPHKTVEGFVGGLAGAIVAGAIVGKEVTPWSGMRHGLVLGLIVGLIAPAGDLFESMIKRDLGVKDSGSILAGHGGLLDRFDSILLALPAAYFVATYFHLVKP